MHNEALSALARRGGGGGKEVQREEEGGGEGKNAEKCNMVGGTTMRTRGRARRRRTWGNEGEREDEG